MLRKDIFGGAQTPDTSDRINRIIAGTDNGNLVCVNAEIDGAMDGQLMVENLLVLRATARIKGDIQTMKLHIEEGAFFEGACVMRAGVSTQKLDVEASFND